MWFPAFRISRRSRVRPARPARRPASSRLTLEPLEDRTLLSFLAPVSYAAGLGPQAVAVGAFRAAGQPLDLVTANSASNSVSVLLGNGDGTFQAARNFATGLSPTSVAVGDFNGDGKLDIVTANYGSSTVSVLLGNGDGTFQAARDFATDLQPGPLAVGDFNGDGKLDLVVTSFFSGTVSVFLGNGDGTFQPARSTVLPGGQNPYSVAVGDFNGDGKLDLAVSGATPVPDPYCWYCPPSQSYLNVLLGNGDGTFTTASTTAVDHIYSVALGDFNGDKKLDVVMTNGTSTVGVFLGNGDGTLQAPRYFTADLNTVSHNVAVGDFNRDGKLDIVTLSGYYTSTSVNVLLGNGDGTFQVARNYYAAGVNDWRWQVAVGDFNGDGLPDLAVVDRRFNNVSVLLNAPGWPVTAPQATSFEVSGFPSPTTAGTAGAFTVTAKTPSGTTATNYTGTVLLTSSDPLAVSLPAGYTFVAADNGVHTFSATLKRAGTQSITVTDIGEYVRPITGSQPGITVNAAGASILQFDTNGRVDPNTVAVYVLVMDPYHNPAAGYRGTVHFSSTDPRAVLPADYTFTATDRGYFTDQVTLITPGWQTVTATDTVTPSLSDSWRIFVNPGAASQFILSAPASVTAGVPFSLTITVEDAYGNVATGYTRTVCFSSSDPLAVLPTDYTFTAADLGVHTFSGIVLWTVGPQKLTLTDTLLGSLTGSLFIDVLDGGN
jgi:hypothetical protein